MGNKKRGNLPPIVRDHAGYHITHELDNKTNNHTGKLSIFAGKNKKESGFKTLKEALDYIDGLINNM